MEVITYSSSFAKEFFKEIGSTVSDLIGIVLNLFTFVPSYIMTLVYSGFVIIVGYFVWRFVKGVFL